jgi:hypothetical protein
MGVAHLDIPQSPRDAVFRAMETIVRGNAIFQRIVKPSSFRTWQGNPEDAREFTFEIAPAMRWTPMNTGEQFRTPDTMSGDLLINAEILLKGTNVSDMQNFWWMVTRCFYPPSTAPGITRNGVIQALQTAAARSGLVLFSQPAFDPSPDGTWLAGQGQIKIELQSQLLS